MQSTQSKETVVIGLAGDVMLAMQVNIAREQNYDWSMKRIQKLSQEFGTTITTKGLWNRTEPLISI